VATDRVAILFDIDGTLLVTGGAGARSWRLAFDELYGIEADIGAFTDAGMTDPDVGRRTFVAVLHREPKRQEFTRLLERRLYYLHETVRKSREYRVLAGVAALLPALIDDGLMLGLVTGNVEAAAHIKLSRAGFNRYFPFGGYGSDSGDRVELTKRALERGEMLLGHPLDPKKTLVVGDTPKDLDAAHGAGCVALGVATGHYSREQLEEAGADIVLETLRDPFPGAD